MKHLQSYEDFQPIQEGWKDLGTGLLLTLSSLFTQAQSGVDTKQHVTLHDAKSVERYLKTGWQLTSTDVDTLWTEIKRKAPEATVEVIQLHFSQDQLFASGSFGLSNSVQTNLDSVLNFILQDQGLLLKVDVEASTDKQALTVNLQQKLRAQGFTGDNAGLAKARATAVQDYLEGKGVNDSLMHTVTKAEQGQTIVDKQSRYVTVDFYYIKTIDQVQDEQVPQTYKLKTTYHLEKDVEQSKKHYKFKGPNSKQQRLGPIKNHKSVADLKCAFTN